MSWDKVILSINKKGAVHFIDEPERQDYCFSDYLDELADGENLEDFIDKGIPKIAGVYECTVIANSLGPDVFGDYDLYTSITDAKLLFEYPNEKENS